MNEGRLPPYDRLGAEASVLPSDDPALAGLTSTAKVVGISGEIPADEIQAGDIVIVMARAGYSPVLRVVETMVDLHRRPDAAPVLITEGAFDRFSPNRNTVVAPQTLIGLDDWLVPVSALLNGRSIRPTAARGYARYVQFEMGKHDMVIADGLRIATLRRGETPCRRVLTAGSALQALRAAVADRLPGLEAARLLPPGKPG
jgi:hypothetical protein